MSSNWKLLRLKQIINPVSKKAFIIPVDHWGSQWPMQWLEDAPKLIEDIAKWWADTVLWHVWIWAQIAQNPKAAMSFIAHLSTLVESVWDKNHQILINNVENAVRSWATWISVHVNVWSDTESEQLTNLWIVWAECNKYWIPLLAMMYSRWKWLKWDPSSPENIARAARIWAELWADIVKVAYTWSADSFKTVTDWCFVPVVIAWWNATSEEELFQMTIDSVSAWWAWVCFWRNIFQNSKRVKLIWAISSILHKRITLKEAMDRLEIWWTFVQDTDYLNSLAV